MPVIDTTADVLNVLEQQGAPKTAIAAVQDFQATVARIKRERYSAAREGEELAAARAAVVVNLQAVADEAEAALDKEQHAVVAKLETARATRRMEKRELGDTIDLVQLRTT